MEIERKFVCKMADSFTTVFGQQDLNNIEQFYTYISDNSEVRYRASSKGFTKTIKNGSGLTRGETETIVTETEFDIAKTRMIGNYIEKERMKIPHGQLTIEIDVYSRPISNGWAVVEVEFPNETEAQHFSLPDDITKAFSTILDVTTDERFKNKNIALYGFPSMNDTRHDLHDHVDEQ